MYDPNAQRRNHFSHHDRRTESQPYLRQTSHSWNNTSNATVQNGSRTYRGQKDHFNNWNTRNDNWRQRGAVDQYGRTARLDDEARTDFEERHSSQMAHTGPSRAQNWDNSLHESDNAPAVDEWGREIRRRRRSTSSEEENREYDLPGERSMHINATGRGHYERPPKRQHSSEVGVYRTRHGSANYDLDHNYPPINKKPRVDPISSVQVDGWRKQSNYYTGHNYSQEHVRCPPSEGFAHDPHQFEAPRSSNFNRDSAATISPAKGHYSRRPAVQEIAKSRDVPRVAHPPAALLEPSSQARTLNEKSIPCTTISLLIAPNPYSRPASVSPIVKTSRPVKSALVRQFFSEDGDEDDVQIPGLPLPDLTPLPNNIDMSANESVSTKEPHTQENSHTLCPKSQLSPPVSKLPAALVLPLSPVSKSPPTPRHKGDSTSPQEITMDISPIDTAPIMVVKDRQSSKDVSNMTLKDPPGAPATAPRDLEPERGSGSLTTQTSREPFEFLGVVGVGAYGKVFKAKDVQTGKLVALKKIKTENHDGFPVTALREIKLLQGLSHDNVVSLQEIVTRKGYTFLKLEYVEHDLAGLLHQSEFQLLPEHIKSLARQLCEGLFYIHSRSVLHRDLKTANLLVTSQGILKLGDFGLARYFNKRKKLDYTNRVCTYWYRAPELMLGETIYGPEIDMWSAGCIFMELSLKRPPFCAEEEVDQLHAIYSVLGTPNENYAPRLLEKPWFTLLPPLETRENRFKGNYSEIVPDDALDFAARLLHMEAAQRPSASAALEHPYFVAEPTPVPPNLSIIKTDWHEYEYQTRRRKERNARELRSKADASAISQRP